MKKVELHCDGFSENYNGQSGLGIILIFNGKMREWSIPIGNEKIARSELRAIIEGLKLVKEACEIAIYSDNQVTIKCITGEYRASSNLDLWEQYHEAAKGHVITATWNRVGSTQYNIRANELSMMAVSTQREWQGGGKP